MKIVTARQAMKYALGWQDAELVEAPPGCVPVSLGYCWMISGIMFCLGGLGGYILRAVT